MLKSYQALYALIGHDLDDLEIKRSADQSSVQCVLPDGEILWEDTVDYEQQQELADELRRLIDLGAVDMMQAIDGLCSDYGFANVQWGVEVCTS